MVASQDSETVYITGGYGRGRDIVHILAELQCSGSTPNTCAFKHLETTNEIARENHIAIPITESLANKLCN